MIPFLLRKLASSVLLLYVVATMTFFMLNLTGQDPARQIAGTVASEEQVELKRQQLGLDQPVIQRYIDWLGGAIHGDLGTSWFLSESVTKILGQALPVTLSIVVGSIIVAGALGIVLGVATAIRQGGWLDRSLQILSIFAQAVPNFVISIFLVLIFAVNFGLLPATGYVKFETSPLGWVSSIILPVTALAIGGIASVGLQVRGSMIDVLREDFVRTLRARGLPNWRVLFVHVLRNSAPPGLTTLALMFIVSISGSIVVERIFNLPGIGSVANQSASQGDLPLVLGVVILTVALVVIVNLLMDVAQGLLNPKVRVA